MFIFGRSLTFRAWQIGGGALVIGVLAGCGTTRPLPPYEAPLARTEFQTVRTTAYTHTETDHIQYGQSDALGGTLRAAAPPTPYPALAAAPAVVPRAQAVEGYGSGGLRPAITGGAVPMNRSLPPAPAYAAPSYAAQAEPPVYGSAAADWSRWPAGTVFRILSTGQVYRVDDYGWALSGRNTIDLYMPTHASMNAWAVRRVPIQILQWGDRSESLRILRGREKYRHIHRMVLELEGEHRAAARLR